MRVPRTGHKESMGPCTPSEERLQIPKGNEDGRVMTIAKARPLEHVLDPLKSGLDVEPAYQIDRDPSLRLSLPVPGEEGRRMTGRARCSSCGSEDLDFFHHAEGVPVNRS